MVPVWGHIAIDLTIVLKDIAVLMAFVVNRRNFRVPREHFWRGVVIIRINVGHPTSAIMVPAVLYQVSFLKGDYNIEHIYSEVHSKLLLNHAICHKPIRNQI